MNRELQVWEGEGGAVLAPPFPHAAQMSGTANQVEWALRIRRNVSSEFDRVADSFRSVAEKQYDGKRADTEAILAILEEKRREVMKKGPGWILHPRLARNYGSSAADDRARCEIPGDQS